jgi:hypothetical protein
MGADFSQALALHQTSILKVIEILEGLIGARGNLNPSMLRGRLHTASRIDSISP